MLPYNKNDLRENKLYKNVLGIFPLGQAKE